MRAGRPPGTASGRPPGTASRLTSGMARPGTKGGQQAAGMSLTTNLQVSDRPITQQGLGGLKTGAKGPHRQVQDKSYFVGLLRSKTTELTQEVARLSKDVDVNYEESSSYLTYEKRAESLANEIKDLQAELGDYNTLVDKLNTDEDIQDIQLDLADLKASNEKEAKNLDALFLQKQEREGQIHKLEVELEQEKRMADNLVADMKPAMRDKYLQLKDLNEHLLKQLENGQQEVDQLDLKKAELEEELSMSTVKQEAVRLYEQLNELEVKRDSIMEELQSSGTPEEERERLLKQVKEDNQEMSSMDRQCNEIREKVSNLQEEIRQLDMDIEENQGERNQKYKELKKREETMTEFLESFDQSKNQELERKGQLQLNIVALLEHMSRNMARGHNLPTPKELATMKDDLAFKATEMKKSEATAAGLASEQEKLQLDLQKVEQLESKITSELEMMKNKIANMEQEIEIYSNLDGLKEEADVKRQKLSEDKVILQKRREVFKKIMQQLTSQYEALKSQLQENETYAQLGNLEKKWQHHEQNNFVMKEFIASKTMESDYRPITKRVSEMISVYNKFLQDLALRTGVPNM
ncbi:unnamed protein product [Owenia fusiformis]|uniref:Uncharacterized protein n=1 Tax=Owenia fusiformis TaxID=6347 RepID=A0A8J1UTZ6_OWEFU|nr:unnamed protein product [Owenia fusiformis]